MLDISLLDTFKDAYLALLLERAEWLIVKEEDKEYDERDLYLAYDYSLVKSIQEEIKNLNLSIALFFKAKTNHNELMMRAALLRISTYSAGIFKIFDNTINDVDRIFHLSNLPKFLEDYKIPKRYNFPIS